MALWVHGLVQMWNSHSVSGIHLFEQKKNVVLLNGNGNLRIKLEIQTKIKI